MLPTLTIRLEVWIQGSWSKDGTGGDRRWGSPSLRGAEGWCSTSEIAASSWLIMSKALMGIVSGSPGNFGWTVYMAGVE